MVDGGERTPVLLKYLGKWEKELALLPGTAGWPRWNDWSRIFSWSAIGLFLPPLWLNWTASLTLTILLPNICWFCLEVLQRPVSGAFPASLISFYYLFSSLYVSLLKNYLWWMVVKRTRIQLKILVNWEKELLLLPVCNKNRSRIFSFSMFGLCFLCAILVVSRSRIAKKGFWCSSNLWLQV